MPGQPLTRSVHESLEAIGGEEVIFGWLADGETVASCTRLLSEHYGEEHPALANVSRGVLSTWCNREERREDYLEARRMGALAFAEESLEIVDNVPPEKGHVAKAKLRSDTRRWLAGKLDHDAWGDRTQGGVVLNLNQLHLEAVRELGRAERPALEGDVVDAEFEEVGEGSEPEDEDWLG